MRIPAEEATKRKQKAYDLFVENGERTPNDVNEILVKDVVEGQVPRKMNLQALYELRDAAKAGSGVPVKEVKPRAKKVVVATETVVSTDSATA